MTEPDRASPGTDATLVMVPDNASSGVQPRLPVSGAPSAQPDPSGHLELTIGSLFAGRYYVEALLGRGGMGVVYRSKDQLLDERVALKLLDVGAQIAGEAIDMFKREVRIARRVTHPHVVRIHGYDEHRGLHFITMEFVEGSDLRREIERRGGTVDPARAARIGVEIAKGLDAAHTMGVVHRDLKPENVLIDASGRSILSDFGIARMFDRAAAEQNKTGHIIGTPAYMAPEQVASGEIGPAVDIYALGVVLFEMLAGRTPFVGDNPIAVAVARLQDAAPDVRSFAAVPEPLAALVKDCLERAPEARPPTAAVIAAELEGFLASGLDAGAMTRRPLTVRSPAKTARGGQLSRLVAVPFGSGRMSLACLPFTYRGPADHEYLGEALSGELTDVLSRTKGLRVLSSGAVSKVEERDPRKITEALDVDYVVDGTVQVAGPKLRITVRLVDASGAQLFSEKFDLGFADLFEMQDEAGRRIAEALRLEIVTRSASVDVPEEAMQLYLQARRILRAQLVLEAPKAIRMLEQALELCPSFAPALASLAIASVHVWFYPQGDRSRDWEAAADAVVARALVEAPDLVETHVAAARTASQRGRLKDAVVALHRAVDIAPTSPDAQHLLGQLECETGRLDQGLARLALAHQLEPTGVLPYERARAAAFRGDHAAFDKDLAEVWRRHAPLFAMHLELRHAGWWGDKARLESIIERAPALGAPFSGVFVTIAKCLAGEADPQQGVAVLSGLMPHVNVRFGGLLRQVLVEVHARSGDLDGALEWLREANATVLYDLAWLEACPLLTELRKQPDFATVLAEVRDRCQGVWR
ncbi:MAG: protein kinase [Polyangiaceae bacterium]|nr:protein kinase [Polyangiaceae bacterium]